MMQFKYNSDCTIDEKVKIVIQEIRDAYPSISIDDAKKIAILDDVIDDKITNDNKFIRYYNILLVLNKKHPVYNQILKDIYIIYQKGLQNEKLILTMEEIIKYVNNERIDFPILSEFYN